jgi:TonB family protein
VNRIFTVADTTVVPPVSLRQEMPRLVPAMVSQAKDRGVVEVIIDEQGRVAQAFIRESVHPMYDALLLAAARDWRYRPATLEAEPVRYRKMIQINVSRH